MARGRKKGGLNVNSINDNNQLTNMIINQINSLNKKIKSFKEKGIDTHMEYIKNIISDDMGQFTENGTLSKSKKFYGEKHQVWLKKTLTALHKINNHDFFGTTRKYEKEVNKNVAKVQEYTRQFLEKKGYSQQFIIETINDKNFIVALFDAFKDVGKGYGSDQIIEKIALSYSDNNGLDSKEVDKILNNIEYSKNVLDRLKEEQDAFNEFKRNKKLR